MVSHGYPWLTMHIMAHFPGKIGQSTVFENVLRSCWHTEADSADPADPPETMSANAIPTSPVIAKAARTDGGYTMRTLRSSLSGK